MDDKKLPAVSIALVETDRVVWAQRLRLRGSRTSKKPATAETIYRVGSVSKLFTDIARHAAGRAGQLDLDAPVTKYLPDFKPDEPVRATSRSRCGC